MHVAAAILDYREMVVVQLAQSAFGLAVSVLAALSQIGAQRHARSVEPLAWRSEGCSTGAPAIVTLRLGSR